MKLSIVILSYNTKKILADCLESVFRSCPEAEIIVVDNASTDDSPQMVKSQFPKVKLVESKKNLGFGKANNLGAKKSNGDIVLFLNSDTIVPRGSLQKLIKFFENNPLVGIVGPKVLLPSGEIQSYSFGDDVTLINLIKDKFTKGILKARCKKVDWVTGAALAIRREAYDATYGFDENFFMYFEDNDLCMRVRAAGFYVYLCPQSEIIHLGGKSLKSNQKRLDIYFQSQDYFFKKHYGLTGLIIVRLMRLPYRMLKWDFSRIFKR